MRNFRNLGFPILHSVPSGKPLEGGVNAATAISAYQARRNKRAPVCTGEKQAAIARSVGVSPVTVWNYARKLKAAGGLPAVRARQVATIPAAQAYVEGDDGAIRDLLGLMDLKAQAETMRTLVQARNVYASSRSCDVAELYEILHYSAHQSKAVLGAVATDDQLRSWWTGVIDHIRAHYPQTVDRMSRVGIPL